jgi:hypothetical protein
MERMEIVFRATQSRETLRSQLKALSRQHADRIRKLDNTIIKMTISSNQSQGVLPGVPDFSLDEEMTQLIFNPLSGL